MQPSNPASTTTKKKPQMPTSNLLTTPPVPRELDPRISEVVESFYEQLDQSLANAKGGPKYSADYEWTHQAIRHQAKHWIDEMRFGCQGTLDSSKTVYYLLERRLHELGCGQAPTPEATKSAIRELSGKSEDARTLLRPLIPDDIWASVEFDIASQKYNRNQSATAEAELDVYLYRLEQRRLALARTNGLSTGIKSIDDDLPDLPGITVMAGPAGVAKTTLALQIARTSMKKNKQLGLLYLTLDMPRAIIYDRILCIEGQVTQRELLAKECGTDNTENLNTAIKVFEELGRRMRFVEALTLPSREDGATGLQAYGAREYATAILQHRNQLCQSGKVSTVLIVVDLLQNLFRDCPEADGVIADKLRIEVAKLLQECTKSVTNPYGDPIVLVSEVRKREGQRDRISCDDVLGSTHLVSTASTVLLLSPDSSETRKKKDCSPITITVGKARDGGIRGEHKLWFSYPHYRFLSRDTPQTSSSKPGLTASAPRINPAAKSAKRAPK